MKPLEQQLELGASLVGKVIRSKCGKNYGRIGKFTLIDIEEQLNLHEVDFIFHDFLLKDLMSYRDRGLKYCVILEGEWDDDVDMYVPLVEFEPEILPSCLTGNYLAIKIDDSTIVVHTKKIPQRVFTTLAFANLPAEVQSVQIDYKDFTIEDCKQISKL